MILSGAGLSAPSGLKTFRDSDGLWEEYDVMEVCSIEGFNRNPKKVLDFYDARRAQLKDVEPNYAHRVIAQIKDKYRDDVFIITQNVDDLLERAGCKNVIHLHGFLREIYCMNCGYVMDIGYDSIEGKICQKCKSAKVRHNIVMFGESAPQYRVLYELLQKTDLFISIGTSGEVLPIWQFATQCKRSIINAINCDENILKYFDKVYRDDIVTCVDDIRADIDNFL